MASRRRALRTALVATAAWLAVTAAGGDPQGHGRAVEASSSQAAPGLVEAVPYARGAVLDVHRPPPGGVPAGGARPPTVVLVHGCCGDRADLGWLAEALTGAGALVLNADWAGIDADARFPDAYEEVACAVRFARARAGDFGGDPARVVLAGWSDGALAATVVATGGDTFDAARCVHPDASARPDAVVGIAGFYGWPLPVPARYVTPRAESFLGGTPASAAESWARATPYGWPTGVDEPPAVLLVGTTDPLVDDARRYAAAQRAAGRSVRLLELPQAGDQTLLSPRTREGQTVVAEVMAAGGRSALLLCQRFPGLAPCDPA
jgi:acetyl esterase/lipase